MYFFCIPVLDCSCPQPCSLYYSWPRLWYICHPEHPRLPQSPCSEQGDTIPSLQLDQQPLYPSHGPWGNWCDRFGSNQPPFSDCQRLPGTSSLDQLGGHSCWYFSCGTVPCSSLAFIPQSCHWPWNESVVMCCLCLGIFCLLRLFWWGYEALSFCHWISWETRRSSHWKFR